MAVKSLISTELNIAFVFSSSFTPEIDEPVLSDAKVNLGAVSARKELFSGKTFIFLSAKQVSFLFFKNIFLKLFIKALFLILRRYF